MTTKHTPGPWRLEKNGDDLWIVQPRTGGQGIEHVISHFCDDFTQLIPDAQDAREANAHLIAAAPDLLAALEAAHGYLVMMGTDHADHIRSVCRAAIVKAKGDKP